MLGLAIMIIIIPYLVGLITFKLMFKENFSFVDKFSIWFLGWLTTGFLGLMYYCIYNMYMFAFNYLTKHIQL
jgi:hypothetical protein